MNWMSWAGVAVATIGIIIILCLLISRKTQDIKRRAWLEKMVDLNRANYIGKILIESTTLSPLFSLAQSQGFSFGLHPDSYRFSERKNCYVWDVDLDSKEIRISVNPKTGRIIPTDLWEQRFIMAHEMGHIFSPEISFNPPCYQDKIFVKNSLSKDGSISCLFLELKAEIEGKRILQQVFVNDKDRPELNETIESRHKEIIDRMRRVFLVCQKEIKKGRCPKKEQIGLFFEMN